LKNQQILLATVIEIKKKPIGRINFLWALVFNHERFQQTILLELVGYHLEFVIDALCFHILYRLLYFLFQLFYNKLAN